MRAQANRPRRRSSRTRQQRSSSDLTVLVVVITLGLLVVLLARVPLSSHIKATTLPWSKPPSVTVIADEPLFSPTDDGNQDTVIITYHVSDQASVTVDVLDEGNRVVRTLLRNKEQAPGRYSITWDGRDEGGGTVPDGNYRIRVAAKGESGTGYNNTQVTVDTQPPVIRLANIPDGMQVKDAELVIEGVTDANATVWVNNDPQPITLDGSGGFSIRRRLLEGENRLELVAIDDAGNSSSVVRTVTLLTKPPDIIVDNPPDGIWINQKLLTVKGRGQPNTTVKVGGRSVQTEDDGAFEVETLLQEGENVVRIEAYDAVGNVSTVERTVNLKTHPPAITVSNLDEGMVVREPSILFSGRTEPESTLLVNGHEVPLDRRGGFQTMVNLVEGDNVIKLDVEDRAGNVATLARMVKYDTTAAALATGGIPTGQSATTASQEPPPSVISLLLRPVGTVGGIGLTPLDLALGAGIVVVLWLWMRGRTEPVALSLSVDQQTFAPYRPGEPDRLIMFLHLSRPAKITIEVLDQLERPLTLLEEERRWDAGDHHVVWDGADDYGNMVPTGPYLIEATASTWTSSVRSAVEVYVDAEPTIFTMPHYRDRTRGRDRRPGNEEYFEGEFYEAPQRRRTRRTPPRFLPAPLRGEDEEWIAS